MYIVDFLNIYFIYILQCIFKTYLRCIHYRDCHSYLGLSFKNFLGKGYTLRYKRCTLVSKKEGYSSVPFYSEGIWQHYSFFFFK